MQDIRTALIIHAGGNTERSHISVAALSFQSPEFPLVLSCPKPTDFWLRFLLFNHSWTHKYPSRYVHNCPKTGTTEKVLDSGSIVLSWEGNWGLQHPGAHKFLPRDSTWPHQLLEAAFLHWWSAVTTQQWESGALVTLSISPVEGELQSAGPSIRHVARTRTCPREGWQDTANGISARVVTTRVFWKPQHTDKSITG